MSEEVDVEGIDPRFHEVVRTHGRALWVLVFNANMAQEALKVVLGQAEKHQSRALAQAVAVLTAVLNEQGTAYIEAKGWTKEEIEACGQGILLAVEEQRIQLIH